MRSGSDMDYLLNGSSIIHLLSDAETVQMHLGATSSIWSVIELGLDAQSFGIFDDHRKLREMMLLLVLI